jgi:uncharacterized protein (DUF488 family)
MSKTSSDDLKVWTVGHSTRSLEDLLALLAGADGGGIETMVDVRTVPRSRRLPHFNRQALAEELPAHGVQYVHMPELGGFRHASPTSTNTGWHNASFRGFADYMQGDAFEEALASLIEIAAESRTAIMCSEAVPWRCHRSLISDALTARGIPVAHLVGRGRPQRHALTSFAHVEDGRVTYPSPEPQLALSLER